MRKFLTLFPVLMLLCALAYGQARTITGIVRDDKGAPVPFATIAISGTNSATQADANGKFSISASKGATLVVTAVNFKEQRLSVGDRSAYDVRLNSSLNTMDEVIVTA
ncbi:MAG TPA: carboxypeptidase-like regulatory domain-containing protein, partial [Flavisolibacter sp.]|nr:carboxypeptidase-like regulatory domain-containing protein [Flavisolibacter sp.]